MTPRRILAAAGLAALRFRAIAQFTEARTLRASATVSTDGGRLGSACYPYFLPAVALSLRS